MPPFLELLTAASMIMGPVGHVEPRTAPPASPQPARHEMTVPLAEIRAVLALAGGQLDQLVRRTPNHGASAIHRDGDSETPVEWRTLRVSGVHDVGVSPDDRRLGISRRYLCRIRAMGHRIWLPEPGQWSEWRADSHPRFPRQVEVIRQNGRWRADIGDPAGFSPQPVDPGMQPEPMMAAQGPTPAR